MAVDAPNLLERSGMDIGQRDPLHEFKIVELRVSLKKHCMFPDDLHTTKLPFRRDSIDKPYEIPFEEGKTNYSTMWSLEQASATRYQCQSPCGLEWIQVPA